MRNLPRRLCVLPVILMLFACTGGDPASDSPPTTQGGGAAQPVLLTNPAFADTDPHPSVGTKPRRYPVHGIDASRWQGDIDWRKARAAGVAFAYLKATEGGDVVDPMFHAHWEGARKAGVRTGAYHYFYFCRSAAEQAQWFFRNVPRDAAALPPVLDMEWNHRSPTCQHRPNGARVRAEAQTFLDMLERHYGKRPVIYTTVDFYHDTGIGQLKDTQFWLRSVADAPRNTYPGQAWTFWQYTGTGIVPGVPTPVDINVFYGTVDQWRAWSN